MSMPVTEGTPDSQIGERVHQLMWRARITQTQLAPRLGMTQAALSRKLRGERSWYAEDLIAVSRALNVSVGYLFGETTNPRQDGPDGGLDVVRPKGFEPPTFWSGADEQVARVLVGRWEAAA